MAAALVLCAAGCSGDQANESSGPTPGGAGAIDLDRVPEVEWTATTHCDDPDGCYLDVVHDLVLVHELAGVEVYSAEDGSERWAIWTSGVTDVDVAADTVLIGTERGVDAYSADAGARLWSAPGYEVRRNPHTGSNLGDVAVGSGRTVMLSAIDDLGFQVVDLASGDVLADGATVVRTTCRDRALIVASDEQNVAAFDAVTGEQLWTKPAEPPSGPTSFNTGCAADTVQILGGAGLVGLDLDDGRERWRIEVTDLDAESARLVTAGDGAARPPTALVSDGARTMAVDAETGAIAWVTDDPTDIDQLWPLSGDRWLQVPPGDDGDLIAIAAATGDRTVVGDSFGSNNSFLAEGALVVIDEGGEDPDGAEDLPGWGEGHYRVRAFDPDTLKLGWSVDVAPAIPYGSSLVAAGDHLVMINGATLVGLS